MIPGLDISHSAPGNVTPGSQSYTTPGTYTFTVPSHNTLVVVVKGPAGGGGSGVSWDLVGGDGGGDGGGG